MDLSKDEVGALIDAVQEYAEHHLPTLVRSMPALVPGGKVDELRGNYFTLLSKLRRELAKPSPQPEAQEPPHQSAVTLSQASVREIARAIRDGAQLTGA